MNNLEKMIQQIKYIEGMALCNIDYDELFMNIDSPAKIDITCDYKIKEFCVCAEGGCDFRKSITESEAKDLNSIGGKTK